MKKTIIAVAAAALLSATMATGAMAAPHHGGHSGGHAGGGAHFRGGRGGRGGFGGLGAFALGAGLGGLYDYDAASGCYQTRLVPTPFGPRYRTVDVCGY